MELKTQKVFELELEIEIVKVKLGEKELTRFFVKREGVIGDIGITADRLEINENGEIIISERDAEITETGDIVYTNKYVERGSCKVIPKRTIYL